MPFSHDEFLDLFAVYNGRLWPPIVILWAASLGVLGWWAIGTRRAVRPVMVLLAVHWAWSGIAFHWWHFRAINPAATLFAAGFVAQAAIFAWLARRAGNIQPASAGPRRVLGMILLLYGMAYPVLGLVLGLSYPRMPLFAVPCPTVLITAGVLVMLPGLPRWASIVPLLWALIGSSAAFSLGIRTDLALVAAAGVLGLDLLTPALLGRQRDAGPG